MGKMIDKDSLKKIVDVFYQHDFKIFYINSTDDENFAKPSKAFISLGITTTPKTLQYIANSITLVKKELRCTLGEIKSVSKGSGQYLNTIKTVFDKNDISQYHQDVPDGAISIKSVDDFIDSFKISLEESKESLGMATKPILEKEKELTDLETLVERYRDCDDIWLYKDSSDKWTAFHECVNYEKRDDGEYRLGILVEEI